MIHLFAAIPLIDIGGYEATVYGGSSNQAWARSESWAVQGDGRILATREWQLTAFLGVVEQRTTMQTGVWTFNGTTITVEAEVGPQFRFGDSRLTGLVDFGAGVDLRVPVRGSEVQNAAIGAGSHGTIGAEFGTLAVRPVVALKTAFTVGDGWHNGFSVGNDGSRLSWSWSAVDIRVLLCAGLTFPTGAGAAR